ncbi:transposable element Tcb2 transposase [Trichonephila clavipes]|nr:transposable element Tcb2 transposase [Trichonephila clavipes]
MSQIGKRLCLVMNPGLSWGTDDNHVRVWRHPGEWYNSPHTILRHIARTAGVMVWGAIAYDSRSTLIVMRGTLTGQRYVYDILRPHVGPFLNGLPGAIFQSPQATGAASILEVDDASRQGVAREDSGIDGSKSPNESNRGFFDNLLSNCVIQ